MFPSFALGLVSFLGGVYLSSCPKSVFPHTPQMFFGLKQFSNELLCTFLLTLTERREKDLREEQSGFDSVPWSS